MSFRFVKDWGLALLVVILLSFAVFAHTESKLYKRSINSIEDVYNPLLNRITKLGYLLKSTEINYEIFRRRDIPQVSTNSELIAKLNAQVEAIKFSSDVTVFALVSALETESITTVLSWKRFESLWIQNPDLSSDDIQLWSDTLSVSLEELNWILIGLRDASMSNLLNQQVADTLSLVSSIANELDAFLTQEPIFIEDVIEPLKSVISMLSDPNAQTQLLEIDKFASGHAPVLSNEDEPVKTDGMADSLINNDTNKLVSILRINDAALADANSLYSVLESIQAAEEIDSATYDETILLARRLINDVEGNIGQLESSLNENLNAENDALRIKLARYQRFRHAATILGCLLALMISLYMSIKLSRHAALVTDGTRLLSEGKLDHRIPAASNDQLGDIAKAFNLMAEKLRFRDHERSTMMEEIDRSAKEAAQASSAKSEFMASMSHEIRTPINGVLGTVDLLMREPLSRSQMHLTETIHRSGNALLDIINDILDYSKIEAGSMELENEPFDLRELVEDIGEMAAPSAHSKGLEINYLLYFETTQKLLGDALRIRQILTNLVSNAIKFTEDGGVCIIVKMEPQPEETAQLSIQVQDTGIGLTEEAQSRVFTAFSQASRSTTRKYGGTGLGLSISRQLTEMMNGELSLESKLGFGSTFCLDLELKFAEEVADSVSINNDGDLLNVVLISNHEPTKLSLCSQLKAMNIKPVGISSGRKAIEHMSAKIKKIQNGVDIMIVDRQLSDMSGLEFLHLAHEKCDELHSYNKVKLCSVDEPEYLNDELKRLNINFTINKPVRQSALYNCLLDLTGVSTDYSSKQELREIDKTFEADVLLVEDHPTNQDIVSRMLEIMGCSVTIANNGHIGLEKLKKQRFDLVLMDCDMPVMDGFSATEKYREHENKLIKKIRLPIVALTANALQGDRERCIRAGMDDYASKPVTMDKLTNVLSKWTTNSLDGDEYEASTASANILEINTKKDVLVNDTEYEQANLLDLDIVNQLIDMDENGSMSFFNELLSNFSSNWTKDTTSLEKALASSEQDDIRKMAHRLKSASSTIGATALSSIAAEIEISAKEKNFKFCVSKSTELPTVFESTMGAFLLIARKAA